MKLQTSKVLLFVGLLLLRFGAEAQTDYQALFDNYGPMQCMVPSYDESQLWFVSQKEGRWQLFHAVAANGRWEEVSVFAAADSLLQPGWKVEGVSVTADEQKLYFALTNPEMQLGKIYVCQRGANAWLPAELLGNEINGAVLQGMPSVSADDNVLIFTRLTAEAMVEKNDERALYLTQRDKDGKWQQAYKLPKLLNVGGPISPRILEDNVTVLLAAVREKEEKDGQVILDPKGGFDLYQITRMAEKAWTQPVHLSAYSSALDDAYPVYLPVSKKLLAIGSQDNGRGALGTYMRMEDVAPPLQIAPCYHLVSRVLNAKGHGLDASLRIVDPYTATELARFKGEAATGVFKLVLPAKRNCRLEIVKPGFTTVHQNLNLATAQLTEDVFDTKSFTLYPTVELMLNAYDNSIYEPLECVVQVLDSDENPLNIEANYQGQGIYRINLPLGKKYKIRMSKQRYLTSDMNLDLTGSVFFGRLERDMELQANTQEIAINVQDAETAETMEVDIVVTNLDNNETIYLKAKRGQDGKYKVKLREGDRYEVKVRNPKGYAYYTTQVDMTNPEVQHELDVKLVPLKAKTKLELKAITFEYNSDELKNTSFAELDRVVELLRENDQLRIEIAAHTDDKGTDAYNMKLSERRAQSVLAYLNEKGLPSERLVAKGYGETAPRVANDTDENRALNRRVELRILE